MDEQKNEDEKSSKSEEEMLQTGNSDDDTEDSHGRTDEQVKALEEDRKNREKEANEDSDSKPLASENKHLDDIDQIKTDFSEESIKENDDEPKNNQTINPIDLVLQEIGEQTPGNNGDNTEEKKLTFGIEDDKVLDDDDKEKQDSCSNPEFRYKVLDTIFLFWNTTSMGWVYGQIGPALPDIQFLVGASLQEATWVFTGFAIGYLGGCLLAGLIQDRFNPRLMLFLYTLGTAITIGVLPWLPVLAAMVAIRVINGICMGGQDTGIHSMLFAIWARDGGPFIQMTHVLTALGGIISPLVTQPFVSKFSDEVDQTTSSNESITNNTTHSMLWNTTVSNVTEVNNNATSSHSVATQSTNIHYAFLITGILVLTAAVPFLVAVLQKRRTKKTKRQYSSESVDKNKLPKTIKRIILGILCVNSFVATAYIDLFPSFLTTFVMEQVSWTQKSASTITSVYFATYAVGNFIGVFILAYVTPTKLIAFSYISSALMITGFLLSVLFSHTELIWVTVALAGLTMSGILPTLFTWTQEHVTPITARLASMLLISGSAGVMVNPLLLGYMMEQLSPMWFIYLSLGETIFCALLFTTVFTMSRIYSAQRSSTSPEVSESREISALNEDVKQEEVEKDQISDGKTKIYPRGTLYGI